MSEAPQSTGRVTVTDIDIPFGRLVVLFVKFGLAAIPAALIVSLILSLIMGLVAALFGGMGFMMGGFGGLHRL